MSIPNMSRGWGCRPPEKPSRSSSGEYTCVGDLSPSVQSDAEPPSDSATELYLVSRSRDPSRLLLMISVSGDALQAVESVEEEEDGKRWEEETQGKK